MTHCNYSTTAPSFDCIKYAYNHYEPIPLCYEPIPLNNEQYPIYDVAAFHPDSQSIKSDYKHNKTIHQNNEQIN